MTLLNSAESSFKLKLSIMSHIRDLFEERINALIDTDKAMRKE